ncbi:molybdenum cofactor guanylyltransferase MobA [Pontitalea aquivivens]|uniref:molybdenum cofactor guanylyltransferase MobA n=1 Tax=Pontitalea aquivivens TaxID=3388663 RepID=UPI003970EB52
MPAAAMHDRTPAPLGVILAGGQASRMGGGDKGLRIVAGRALIAHVIDRLGPQVPRMAINANGDPARLAGFGLPVVADSIPGQPGPLAGVLAGLDWAAGLGASAIVTAAADTPFFPPDLVARLQAAAGESGLATAASPDAQGRLRRHPTFGLWPVALRADLRAAIARGQRRIGHWAEMQGAGLAAFDSIPFDPFFNINTPDDIATAARLAGAADQA